MEDMADLEQMRLEQNEIIELIRKRHPGFSASERLTRTEAHDRRAALTPESRRSRGMPRGGRG